MLADIPLYEQVVTRLQLKAWISLCMYWQIYIFINNSPTMQKGPCVYTSCENWLYRSERCFCSIQVAW